MESPGHKDTGKLRAKLEFPIWYRSFTKSYSAWSNAPADLKMPLLLSGQGLAKAESWLLACPEKLTDSQKRFIVRSISQGARDPQAGANLPAGQRGKTKTRWYRTSDRSLWHLTAVIAVGIWVFAPDFIADTLERSLNTPEVLQEKNRKQVEAAAPHVEEPSASPQPVPRVETAMRDAEPADVAAVEPPAVLDVLTVPPTPAPPPVSKAERLAKLAGEQLAAGQPRIGLLIAIEAAEHAAPEAGPASTTPPETALPLMAALAGRDQLAPLALRNAMSKAAHVCADGRTTLALRTPTEAVAWPADGGRQRTLSAALPYGLDRTATDRECRRMLVPNDDFNLEIRALGSDARPVLLHGHEAQIVDAKFNRQGTAIVTASQDSTARIWDAQSGRQRAVLSAHDWHVLSAEFSPDGRRVVTASADKTARIWDAANGRELFVLEGHRGSVTSARFTGDGRRVLTTSWDGFVRIFDAASGQPLITVRHKQGNLDKAVISADGRALATSDGDGNVQLWRITDADVVEEIVSIAAEARSLAFSPDGNWLLIHDWSGRAMLHVAASGVSAMKVGGGNDRIHAVQFAPSGDVLAAITEAGARLTWPVMSSLERTLAYARSIAPPCLSADERTLLGLDTDAPAWCAEIKPRDARLPR